MRAAVVALSSVASRSLLYAAPFATIYLCFIGLNFERFVCGVARAIYRLAFVANFTINIQSYYILREYSLHNMLRGRIDKKCFGTKSTVVDVPIVFFTFLKQ